MAQNVAMLTVARIGVGIPARSAGHARPRNRSSRTCSRKIERPRALGIFAVGTYLGVFLGYFFGGWVNQYYGWRVAFIAAGIPGLVIALLLRFIVTEPVRRGDSAEKITNEAIGSTFAFLFSQRSFVLVQIGFCLAGFTNYATSVWIPPFMARVHHLTSAEIGTYAGTFKGLFGIAGARSPAASVVAQISREDDRWKVWAAGDHVGPCRPGLCALHADAKHPRDGVDARAVLGAGRLSLGADLRGGADYREDFNACARGRDRAADRHVFWPRASAPSRSAISTTCSRLRMARRRCAIRSCSRPLRPCSRRCSLSWRRRRSVPTSNAPRSSAVHTQVKEG